MPNIFEQPWALVGIATVILVVMLVIRMLLPEKRHWLQLAIPLILFAAAFGADYLVKTDLEEIETVIKTVTNGIKTENADLIEPLISDNYRDSYHRTKKQLIRHCRNRLSEAVVEKAITRIADIDITEQNAAATFTVNIVIDPQSQLYDVQRIMLVKIRFALQKEEDKKWLISRIEILELNKQPFKWSSISYLISN